MSNLKSFFFCCSLWLISTSFFGSYFFGSDFISKLLEISIISLSSSPLMFATVVGSNYNSKLTSGKCRSFCTRNLSPMGCSSFCLMSGCSKSSRHPIRFSVLTYKALKRKLLASAEIVIPLKVSSLSGLKYRFSSISRKRCLALTES